MPDTPTTPPSHRQSRRLAARITALWRPAPPAPWPGDWPRPANPEPDADRIAAILRRTQAEIAAAAHSSPAAKPARRAPAARPEPSLAFLLAPRWRMTFATLAIAGAVLGVLLPLPNHDKQQDSLAMVLPIDVLAGGQ